MRPSFSTFLGRVDVRAPKPQQQFTVRETLLSNPESAVSRSQAEDEYRATIGNGEVPLEQSTNVIPRDPLPELSELRAASLDELKQIRRRFARLNHPDLVPDDERKAAGDNLAKLNTMVDDELARRGA